MIKKTLLHLYIRGHDDRSMKLFGSQKRCYDGQWLLTGRYFKDTHREKSPSNKTLALTESMNMDICVVGTLN